jgi:hypothetical protein
VLSRSVRLGGSLSSWTTRSHLDRGRSHSSVTEADSLRFTAELTSVFSMIRQRSPEKANKRKSHRVIVTIFNHSCRSNVKALTVSIGSVEGDSPSINPSTYYHDEVHISRQSYWFDSEYGFQARCSRDGRLKLGALVNKEHSEYSLSSLAPDSGSQHFIVRCSPD